MLVGVALITLAGTMAARADEAQALRELPPLLRAVSDEPGVLSLGEAQALSRRIAEIERDIGVKMIALVVVTVAPESIDAYVQRLINHWKPQRPRARQRPLRVYCHRQARTGDRHRARARAGLGA